MSKIIKCRGCGRTPSKISEYVNMAREEGYSSADDFVMENEGTYNERTGLFWCTDCYIKAGQPLGTA